MPFYINIGNFALLIAAFNIDVNANKTRCNSAGLVIILLFKQSIIIFINYSVWFLASVTSNVSTGLTYIHVINTNKNIIFRLGNLDCAPCSILFNCYNILFIILSINSWVKNDLQFSIKHIYNLHINNVSTGDGFLLLVSFN
jgi:hypothetical protein